MYSGRRRALPIPEHRWHCNRRTASCLSCLKRVSWFSINCKMLRDHGHQHHSQRALAKPKHHSPQIVGSGIRALQSIAGSAWLHRFRPFSVRRPRNRPQQRPSMFGLMHLRSIPICIRTSSNADCTITYHCSALESPRPSANGANPEKTG